MLPLALLLQMEVFLFQAQQQHLANCNGGINNTAQIDSKNQLSTCSPNQRIIIK